MRRSLAPALVVLALASPALAQTPAAPSASADAPAAAADPLKEPQDLVEVAANTKDNLKKAIDLYGKALANDALPPAARIAAYNDTARAWLRLGDLETAEATKLAAYTKGREAAAKALALDPKNPDAIFWDTVNLACIGRTKGVMNSLFMIGDLRKGLGRTLELKPGHNYARQTLAEIDHAVPGFAGGSDDRAEKTYLDIVAKDPSFTPTMVLLARFYRDKGDEDEARKWAKKVIDAPKSSVPNDWRKLDIPAAKKVLKELE